MDSTLPVIHELLQYLNKLSILTLPSLVQSVKELKFSIAQFTPFLIAPGNFPYGRKVLYHDARVEIILMNWNDRHCLPHDHGNSFGVVFILSGKASHTIYSRLSGGHLVPNSHEIIDTNNLIIAKKNLIHKMGSAEPATPFITLHIYSTPIHNMQVYDLNAGKICTVMDDCGAWWPQEAKQIISITDIVPSEQNNSIKSCLKALKKSDLIES